MEWISTILLISSNFTILTSFSIFKKLLLVILGKHYESNEFSNEDHSQIIEILISYPIKLCRLLMLVDSELWLHKVNHLGPFKIYPCSDPTQDKS